MSMKRLLRLHRVQDGFTAVEFIVASVIFVIIVIGLVNSYTSIQQSYTLAREYNEMYTVLSACPEVDRALEFNSISSTANCYPNNSFPTEDGGAGTITYTPALTVTATQNLPSSDPLQGIPDSKVVDIKVGFPPPNSASPELELRMLITRNGIAQS